MATPAVDTHARGIRVAHRVSTDAASNGSTGVCYFRRPVATEDTVLNPPTTHWDARELPAEDVRRLLNLLFAPVEVSEEAAA